MFLSRSFFGHGCEAHLSQHCPIVPTSRSGGVGVGSGSSGGDLFTPTLPARARPAPPAPAPATPPHPPAMSFVALAGDGGAAPTFFEMVAADRLMPALKAALAYTLSVGGWMRAGGRRD